MPVPSTINDLSTTAGSNSPGGGENPFPDLDNYLRAHASFIAALRDGKLDASLVSAFMLTVLNDADAATARATLGAAGLGANTFTGAQTLPGNAVNPLDAMPLQQATGRLLAVRVFTLANTGQTYTPTAGTTSVVVEAVGGGGAGGGTFGTGSGEVAVAGPGTSGSYGKSRFTGGFSGLTLTVGSSGTPASSAPGGNGGTTSFGSLLSCPGGVGGNAGGNATASGAYANSAATAPLAASGVNIDSVQGIPGIPSIWNPSGSFIVGIGGSSPLGAGGINNLTPSGYGGGGGGKIVGGSAGPTPGNAAAPGAIIVWEYA